MEYTWDYKEELEGETVIVVTDGKLQIVFASNNMVHMNDMFLRKLLEILQKCFKEKKPTTVYLKRLVKQLKINYLLIKL